ncbi:unnamed protein product [Echinostoma caproni]|uniref:RES domain-containing protein n=1 Tax=Echinostoma caproni TaxID=27848 RepID=A0A183AX26_9TREM|nr:unnamed protein product [Echinostoma caproni]
MKVWRLKDAVLKAIRSGGCTLCGYTVGRNLDARLAIIIPWQLDLSLPMQSPSKRWGAATRDPTTGLVSELASLNSKDGISAVVRVWRQSYAYKRFGIVVDPNAKDSSDIGRMLGFISEPALRSTLYLL